MTEENEITLGGLIVLGLSMFSFGALAYSLGAGSGWVFSAAFSPLTGASIWGLARLGGANGKG